MQRLPYTPTNDRLIFNLKVVFVLLFMLSIGGVYYYQDRFVRPAKDCEKIGRWWSAATHECGIPIKISDYTGRHMEEKQDSVAPPLQSMPALAVPDAPAPAAVQAMTPASPAQVAKAR